MKLAYLKKMMVCNETYQLDSRLGKGGSRVDLHSLAQLSGILNLWDQMYDDIFYIFVDISRIF